VATDTRTHDDAAPAPGELGVLQRFVNLHEHRPGSSASLPPSTETIRTFLVERGLLDERERFTDADRETALALARALRNLVPTDKGEPVSEADAEVIDRAGLAAGLHPHFYTSAAPTLEPRGEGVAAAFGRIVAIAFVASFDGSWEHLKQCANDDCREVFFDRSKNHSGRWCSMQSCGNRAKVRAWRERQRVHDDA
jgi:predicted RNA-binding Zn ribbon-like protein